MIAGSPMPPSEHVHWWFATGFLVLALCFAARAVVGPGLGPAALASLPVPRAPLLMGAPAVPGDGLLHQLDHPHDRARLLGRDDDARRRRASSASPPASSSPLWNLTIPLALFLGGRRHPRARAERLALLARGLRAPPDRLDRGRRADRPARTRVPAALDRRSASASRPCSSRSPRSSTADRDTAPIFGHLSTRQVCRTGEAGARRRAARGARRTGRGLRPRVHPGLEARVAGAARAGADPRRGRLRPGREGLPERDPRATTRCGAARAERPLGERRPRDRRRSRAPAEGRVHGALAGAFGRRPRRLRRLHVRRPRRSAAADRGLRRVRADDDRERAPLALLRLPGAADRRHRLPARRAAPRRYPTRSSACSACSRSSAVGRRDPDRDRSRSSLRAEDALQLPFGRFLYGDLSPFADDTRFGRPSS